MDKRAKTLTRGLGLLRAVRALMTTPRRIVPGRIYLGTRRCTQRQFLLRPDPVVEHMFLYCLAEGAERYGITLFGWVAMSNHIHVLFRDNLGNFPEFFRHVHSLMARALNSYIGRSENFWSSDQASAVWTVEQVDAFNKLLYVLANPVAAHLVDRVTDWPGASALGYVLSGKSRFFKRPHAFFGSRRTMPEEIELRAARLDGYESLSQEEWRTLILSELTKLEEEARADRVASNRRIMGRKNVLRVPRDSRPETVEPRRSFGPMIACRNRERRKFELDLLKAFHVLYDRALATWRRGDHTVQFPDGTYRMRWFGARADGAPA